MPQDKNGRCADDPEDGGEGSGEPEEWDTARQKIVRNAIVLVKAKHYPITKRPV